MKTFNFVLLFALSAISTSAMSVQAESSPGTDAEFIHTVRKIAADHHFFVQEYKGVIKGMNNRGVYFIASQEDKNWEITPADTWNNPKIKGTTTEDFQSEMSRIHQ